MSRVHNKSKAGQVHTADGSITSVSTCLFGCTLVDKRSKGIVNKKGKCGAGAFPRRRMQEHSVFELRSRTDRLFGSLFIYMPSIRKEQIGYPTCPFYEEPCYCQCLFLSQQNNRFTKGSAKSALAASPIFLLSIWLPALTISSSFRLSASMFFIVFRLLSLAFILTDRGQIVSSQSS